MSDERLKALIEKMIKDGDLKTEQDIIEFIESYRLSAKNQSSWNSAKAINPMKIISDKIRGGNGTKRRRKTFISQ